ncbi:MAG: CDP-diacylglycerol--glycerol-3-phosphate 3-phosphatidyltransferase [Rhodobacteraceae bacterium]|nr:CDP-diacylglycerol--glycerol-3-phosphate 3-phosphatidyltransferase [Paracoccaceae bacterium]
MRWNLPNTLTVARLIAAPLLVLVYEVFPRPAADWLALVLFIAAAITDYVDGMLARRWKQISNFGRMLDPIADKAISIVALAMLAILLQGASLIVIPAMAIILREVFISGLREFLGGRSVVLPVTWLAKWKTFVQMLAVSVLFGHLLFEHYFVIQSFAMEREHVAAVVNGLADDPFGLRWKYLGWDYSYKAGVVMIWVAGLLTLVTGWDYFRKSLPYFDDGDQP